MSKFIEVHDEVGIPHTINLSGITNITKGINNTTYIDYYEGDYTNEYPFKVQRLIVRKSYSEVLSLIRSESSDIIQL